MEQMLKERTGRKAVPYQIIKMAKLFGLTPKILSEPKWQTAWLIDNCNKCHCGGRCFTSRSGEFTDDPNIDLEDCPNYQVYLRIAEGLELHTPKKNGIKTHSKLDV